jgi:hypothetical protein
MVHFAPIADSGFPMSLKWLILTATGTTTIHINLVILCPNCHKMHDLDLISTETIIQMRDRPKIVTWSKRMKDAGKKAALTRKRRTAARKAVVTRQNKAKES